MGEKMDNKVRWLRISYWVGVIADALAALRMLFPEYIMRGSSPDVSYNIGMKWGVALMLGWTVLLIWADRKPLARKGVLLLTICPVIVGLMITSVATFFAGIGTLASLIFNLILLSAIAILMLFSYLNARGAETDAQ
ncbi:MAG: hypothetical protein JSV98_09925 [candidate division WOR-3 bacterium]|nr:MAG: hypothetical protein JSV98_09925 [candidate division WOR-3 bacterium]